MNRIAALVFAVTFAIAFSCIQVPAPAIAEPSSTAEKEAFESAKELGTVEAWDAFLSNYPNGFHADLARAYVKKLGGTGSAAPSAPNKPATTSVANLPPARELSCKEAAKVKSEKSSVPAKIRFINESGVEIVLQWIDFKGGLKEYGTLKPGAELTQDTYLTHPWIAAYMEGSCRQAFLPAEGTTVARLLPENQLSRAEPEPKHTQKSTKKAARDTSDHGPTPAQTCRNIGQDYNGSECVPRKSASKPSKPSKAAVEKSAKASCIELGMIYLNGKCAPKTKQERNKVEQKKNKACPAGMYRNPLGQCQPNQTGA